MNGWKKAIILTMLGTMIVVSGCGTQKEEAVSAPVVKTMIVGEADKEGNFPVLFMDIMNLRLDFR